MSQVIDLPADRQVLSINNFKKLNFLSLIDIAEVYGYTPDEVIEPKKSYFLGKIKVKNKDVFNWIGQLDNSSIDRLTELLSK